MVIFALERAKFSSLRSNSAGVVRFQRSSLSLASISTASCLTLRWIPAVTQYSAKMTAAKQLTNRDAFVTKKDILSIEKEMLSTCVAS